MSPSKAFTGIGRDPVFVLVPGRLCRFLLLGLEPVSQRKAIRTALLAGKKLSGLTALREFGVMRLASRIQEIRNGIAGDHPLAVSDTWRIQKGKRFKVYYVPDAVSARYRSVLLANSKTGARPPGRPRGTRKA